MANCKWHKCQKEFEQTHGSQKFCSKECRAARSQWREVRGACLVDPILSGDSAAIERLTAELIEEVRRGGA